MYKRISHSTSNCPFSVAISHNGSCNGSSTSTGRGKVGGYEDPLQ